MSPLLEVRVGLPWGDSGWEGAGEGLLGAGNVLLLNLGAGYTGTFNGEHLPGCAHDVCTFQYVYYVSIGS